MTLYRAGVGLVVVLVLAAMVHMAVYYPVLPAVVASHFGIDGKVDGTMSREAFMCFYAGTVALLTVLFLGLGFLIPKLPDSTINIPHRDYWLAKERRDETMNAMATYMVWIGAVAMLFIIATIHITILFQLGKITNANTLFYPMFAVFFVALAIWTTTFIRKFRRPAP